MIVNKQNKDLIYNLLLVIINGVICNVIIILVNYVL